MKIAILSGKGGTGKTFVATNLANVVSRYKKVQLLDCDVEEPNSHIFFNVDFYKEESVDMLLPVVDNNKCTRCGDCAKYCEFGAISVFPIGTMVIESLCHGCGLCKLVCPENAISEKKKSIGKLKFGRINENLEYGMGYLNIGEPSGTRIIRELKKRIDESSEIVILDSPPGSSCPVVETLRNVDFALLITESTPFGLHDLRMAVKVVREMGIDLGVVINRYDASYKDLENYLNSEKIEIIERIPFDEKIAVAYSKGQLISNLDNEWGTRFEKIFERIQVVKNR